MYDWLAERAKATPKGLALIIGNDHWSYAELNDLVNVAASNLAKNVQHGQHVGVLMPNSLAYVCIIHALSRIGAILVPLNTRLTNHELSWHLDHSECEILITNGTMAEHVNDLVNENRQLIFAEDLMVKPHDKIAAPRQPLLLERPQAIIFTSGTSGRSKGTVLTFGNHFWSAVSSAFRLGLHNQDRWLSCLPLYHVGGLAVIFRSCLYGTAVVLYDRFDEKAISDSLDTQAITLVSLVPTMLDRLLNFRRNRPWPASLRHLLLGGAAAPTELIQRCHELDIPLSITYGLTEAASQVATMLPQDSRQKPGSAGKPLLFTAVDVVDDQDQTLPHGKIGEICVSGPTVMDGYYKDEQAASQALRGGRLHTGDMGFLDEDGDLWLVQRRSDMIVSGGENIYPSEVENALRQHPAVAAICVVGLDDRHWGQRVAAMIERHPNKTLSTGDLLAFGRKTLAGYKLPRQIEFVDSLPLTASGKIHRESVKRELQKNLESTFATRQSEDPDTI